MTPKEKAEELVDKMKYPMNGVYIISHVANELALILVDEILEMDLPIFEEDCDEFYGYWHEVKQEIEKL
jgi:hypothetical protein